ncbi:MAG TPA: hypothetical protein QF695_01125, partial [Arenicellales bacterium]|nr:hypothetical protein [Arenicellales bacterium]
ISSCGQFYFPWIPLITPVSLGSIKTPFPDSSSIQKISTLPLLNRAINFRPLAFFDIPFT